MNTERQIITSADLPDMRQSGGWYRAGCPIHGSDHQRSLSIQAEGEYAGFGKCHACDARVLVEDLNPEAATRLRALGARPLTADDLLRPIQRRQGEASGWQQQQRATLEALYPRTRAALLASERARAYLEARAIPLKLAEAQGVGYIPQGAASLPELAEWYMQLWVDRLLFPLASPDGRGFIGRALARWHPGMDENEHKRLLDQPGAPERWYKTSPAGWYGLDMLAPDLRQVIIVEGAFDRLALIAAGLAPGDILALAGSKDTHAAEWLPRTIQHAIIALDGDTRGQEAAPILSRALYRSGRTYTLCTLPSDGQGKDWSERWRLGGLAGLSSVLEALSAPVEEQAEAAPIVIWRAAWDRLPIREQVYAMAEALGYPAWEQFAAGEWRAWYAFKEQASSAQIAGAHNAMLPQFER